MPWVWTDELVQRLDADERGSWVPLIGYRVGSEEDLDRLARRVVLGEGPPPAADDRETVT